MLANGTDTVTVPANATQFTLSPVPYGTHYAVTVATQPAGLTCTVSAGSGTMPAANVSVAVVCSDRSYTLGGTVSGLNVAGLVLANGTDSVTVPANATSFTLPTAVAYESSYAVTVATQPAGVTCTVSAGSGTMPATDVTSAAVTCSDHAYTLGGTISGLTASGLILTDGTDRLTVAANAKIFSMPTGVAYTSAYAVTIAAQPAGLACTVTGGTGTMPAADVNSVQVACVARNWTWEGGSETVAGAQANYPPTPGMAATNYVPGPRDSAMSWTDGTGKFWLFGGGGLDVNSTQGNLNDLWSYDPGANEWTWAGGSSTVAGAIANYGAPGVASASNQPGPRDSAMTWTDAGGGMWLFGGSGNDSVGSPGYLNDLWMYNPTTQRWTWFKGSSLANSPANYGTEGVAATNNVPGPRVGAVTWTDPSGHLWMFGGYGGTDSSSNPIAFSDLWSYDPSTNRWTWVNGPSSINQAGNYVTQGTPLPSNAPGPGARLSGMGWTDSAGVLWLFGGRGLDSTGAPGYLNDLWSYASGTNQWTWVSGSKFINASGVYGAVGVTAAGNSPGARQGAMTWTDGAGHRWLFGGFGQDSVGSGGGGFLNDLWTYDPATQLWTWVNGSSTASPIGGAYGTNGTYGILGTAATGNTPGGRVQGVSWIDSADHLWTFGGYGYDQGGSLNDLNDIWKY